MKTLLHIALLCLLLTAAIGPMGGIPSASAQNAAYTDTMDSAADGLLGTGSPDPAQVTFAYQDGTFVMHALDPAYEGELLASVLTPVMNGTQVLFDVSVSGDLGGKYIVAGCRAGPGNGGYQVEVNLDTGEADLRRMHREFPTVIGRSDAPVALEPGAAMNQIGIECQDNRISAIVNGVTVLTAFDPEYTAGHSYVGVGSWLASSDGLDATFDNLTVADLGGSGFGSTTTDDHPPVLDAPQLEPDPVLAPDAAMIQSWMVAIFNAPIAGPVDQAVDLHTNDGIKVPLGVQLDEFFADVIFVTPQSTPGGLWLYGFCFWTDPSGSCTDLFVQSDGTTAKWGLGSFPSTGDYALVDSGDIAAGVVDLTPGAENDLSVLVYNGSAVLAVNGTVAAAVHLSGQPIAGDISGRIEFSSSDQSGATLTMSAQELTVWDMSDQQLMLEDPAAETDTAPQRCRFADPATSACGEETS